MRALLAILVVCFSRANIKWKGSAEHPSGFAAFIRSHTMSYIGKNQVLFVYTRFGILVTETCVNKLMTKFNLQRSPRNCTTSIISMLLIASTCTIFRTVQILVTLTRTIFGDPYRSWWRRPVQFLGVVYQVPYWEAPTEKRLISSF